MIFSYTEVTKNEKLEEEYKKANELGVTTFDIGLGKEAKSIIETTNNNTNFNDFVLHKNFISANHPKGKTYFDWGYGEEIMHNGETHVNSKNKEYSTKAYEILEENGPKIYHTGNSKDIENIFERTKDSFEAVFNIDNEKGESSSTPALFDIKERGKDVKLLYKGNKGDELIDKKELQFINSKNEKDIANFALIKKSDGYIDAINLETGEKYPYDFKNGLLKKQLKREKRYKKPKKIKSNKIKDEKKEEENKLRELMYGENMNYPNIGQNKEQEDLDRLYGFST